MKAVAFAPSFVVCLFSVNSHAQETLLKVPGPIGGSFGGFGRDLACLGDIDGDGLDDFIAANSVEWGSSVDEGVVQVISGSSGAVLFDFRGHTFENIGRGIGAFDDLDGDGTHDFWFTSEVGTSTFRRAIEVYSGASGTMIRSFESAGPVRVGQAATCLGDVNGDGVPDLAHGITSSTHIPLLAGGVYVRDGATGGELYRFIGTEEGELLGNSLATLPDLDGDGIAEILVGAYGASTNGLDSGAARIHSGANGTQLAEFLGAGERSEFGFHVLCAGDVNGDGEPDILVTSRETGQLTGGPEVVYVYSTSDGSELHRFVAPTTDTSFGWKVGAGGDVNGDGFDDVAVGASRDEQAGDNTGSMTLFSGETGQVIFRVDGAVGTIMGWGVTMGGDINGDGYDDVLVAAGYEVDPVTQSRTGVVYALGHEHFPGDPLCFGRPNSTGAAALLTATSPSGFVASSNDLDLSVVDLPQQSPGYFLVSRSADIVVRPGSSDGTLCISGPAIGRFSGSVLTSGAAGSVSFQPDITSIPLASASGQTTVAAVLGDTFNFQYWFRDVTTTGTSNFSSASCVVFR